MQLLAAGRNAAAIAEELFISLPTVKSHMRNVYAKLGVHSQSELIVLVSRSSGQAPGQKDCE